VQKISVKRGRFRTGESAGIWLAFALALLLHVMFLLLPMAGKNRHLGERQAPLEIQLTTVEKQAPAGLLPEPEAQPREPVAEQTPESPAPPVDDSMKNLAEPPAMALPAPPATPRVRELAREPNDMSELERAVLTNVILSRQYITEESAADRLFGKPLVWESADVRKEFHYPLRPDLIEMLNKPLPDLPFEYTPGLIYFAYDPGLKGELQRFWDIITPEFGWRTKYGTEVKCALIVIIPGCVWK
jgi:hypothetical protein